MKLGEELELERVDLEEDAQVLVQAINPDDSSMSSWFGELIEDAKVQLRSKPGWKIYFTPREGNEVAHTLARHGSSFDN